MGATRYRRALTARTCPAGGGRSPAGGGRSRPRLAVLSLALLGILGWSLIATAPSQAALPVSVTVQLTPSSITADGISTTVASATVKNLLGNVPGETVIFTDPSGNPVPGVDSNGTGVYTATLTSSITVGMVTVTATDLSAGTSGSAQLTQTAPPVGSSNTVLSVVPAQPVTNQTATVIATVTAGPGPPSGTVAFEAGGTPIAGCAGVSVTPATGPTAVCQTSFAAANSPVSLTAVFTPSSGANLVGSTSPVDLLPVGLDSTSINLTPPSANPIAGSAVTYRAAVVPNHSGRTQPSGMIQFSDGNRPLNGCASRPLVPGNPSGASAAVCRVTFGVVGPRVITAHYVGDANFTGSDSLRVKTVVRSRPRPRRLSAVLQWTFFYTPAYTSVLSLMVKNVSAGASIQLKCQGSGCPYPQRGIAISNSRTCRNTATQRCAKLSSITVDLLAAFRHRRLRAGALLTVEVLRPGWVGKYYQFAIRARQGPRTRISCLAPGAIRPGVGC